MSQFAYRTPGDQGGWYGTPAALRDRKGTRTYFGPDRNGACGLCGSTRWVDVGVDVDGQRVLRCAGCVGFPPQAAVVEGSFWELRRQ